MTKKNLVQRPLVFAGFILFGLLVLGWILSTAVPFGKMLFTPNVLHFNVAVILIGLTVGALLPFVIGYVIGDGSVKSKNKVSHSFNGVLFGLLAYWIMTTLSLWVAIPSDSFSSVRWQILIVNLIPAAGVAIITAALATSHILSRYSKHDVDEYKPFIVAFVGFTLLMPVWTCIENIISGAFYWQSFVPLASIVIIGAISYITSARTKLAQLGRVFWSTVSISILHLALYAFLGVIHWVFNYAFPASSASYQTTGSVIGWALGLGLWLVYWQAQVRTLTITKK